MNVTVKQIRGFVSVAEHGSFTRAAQTLRMTQSALSALVRELEDELGIRLFDRTTRRVELTEVGREFRASAHKLLADLDHAVHNAHELVERRRGRLTVAAPPLLAAMMLPHAIAAFEREYPGIRIVVLDVPTDQIVARVRAGEADCGIGTFAADEEGIERTGVMRDTFMLFCRPDHALAKAARLTWRDLRDRPMIALTRASGVRALVDRMLARAGASAAPRYEVTQMTSALAFVEAGLGVAVLPSYALRCARFYGLAARAIAEPTVHREIELITRAGRSLPPAGHAFRDVLAGFVAGLEPDGGGRPSRTTRNGRSVNGHRQH